MKKKILISFILVLMILCNIKVYATSETAELPSKYDLRNDINIRVENQITYDQEKGPVCYHYAKVKMIETYLAKVKGINYNLSETFYASHDEDGMYVLESDFPTKLFSQIPNIDNKIEEAKKKAVVTSFNYDRNFNKNDIEKIKRYIQNYGGIVVTTNVDKQWDNYKGGIYRSKGSTESKFHAVNIIGWDDNYSKDNFVYEKPQNNGAWLVLNTWGSSWGNKGTCWLSYEDYYNLQGTEFIGSLTLSNRETIKTELPETEQERTEREEKEEQERVEKETKKEKEQKALEKNRKENIIIIAYMVVFILLIALIVIKIIRNKKNK